MVHTCDQTIGGGGVDGGECLISLITCAVSNFFPFASFFGLHLVMFPQNHRNLTFFSLTMLTLTSGFSASKSYPKKYSWVFTPWKFKSE